MHVSFPPVFAILLACPPLPEDFLLIRSFSPPFLSADLVALMSNRVTDPRHLLSPPEASGFPLTYRIPHAIVLTVTRAWDPPNTRGIR